MLVLSRKQNQKIMVGDNVTITILKVRGNTVRIGIDAPRSIHVVRGELERESGVESEDDSVTFEFKNRSGGNQVPTTFRLIADEPVTDQPIPDNPSDVGNRLRELVAKIGEPERERETP